MSALALDPGAAPFDLTLDVESDGETRTCHLDYPGGLFEPARMQRMTDHYLALLRGAVDDRDRPVALLPMLVILGAPWMANRVEPRIFGFPFLLAWIVGGVLLTCAARYGDRACGSPTSPTT